MMPIVFSLTLEPLQDHLPSYGQGIPMLFTSCLVFMHVGSFGNGSTERTCTMQISLSDPAAHGTDVVTEVVPSGLLAIIFSKNVCVSTSKADTGVFEIENEA